MNDLVERLRKIALCIHIAAPKEAADDVDAACRQAADRIEALEGHQKDYLNPRIDALEKALAIFMQFDGRDEEYTWIDQALFAEARAALNGDKP